MKTLSQIGIGCATILLLLALAIGGLWLYHGHHTQKVRASLAQEIARYAESVASIQSNVVVQCSDGHWFGRVRFLDGDWVAVAHHSRHTQENPGHVGCITVMLMSDGTLYDTYMHYCKDWAFEGQLRCGWNMGAGERTFSNKADFLTNQFYKPLMRLNKDFEPTTEPYSK